MLGNILLLTDTNEKTVTFLELGKRERVSQEKEAQDTLGKCDRKQIPKFCDIILCKQVFNCMFLKTEQAAASWRSLERISFLVKASRVHPHLLAHTPLES